MHINHRLYRYTVIALLLLQPAVVVFAKAQADDGWKRLKENIEYRQIYREYRNDDIQRNALLHVFRIKHRTHKITIQSFHQQKIDDNISLQDLRQRHNALITFSGGFYDPDFRHPVGLVVVNNTTHFLLSKHLSGVVWIKSNFLRLSQTGAFSLAKSLPDYAIQGYPRIVDPVNKMGIQTKRLNYRPRAAVCTTANSVLFMISDKSHDGLSLYELAQIAQSALVCDIAVNLDGGPAPGISVDPNLIGLEIKEGWQLPNAFVIDELD